MTGIYKITNPINQVYIGGTRNITQRLTSYRNGAKKTQRLIHESIQFFDWDNHDFKVIHELPKDIEQEALDRYEQLYMDLYRDAGVVLLNLKGAGQRGKYSKESLKLMSIARIGKKLSDETKSKLSIAGIGRKASNETKRKISTANLGRKHSDGTKVKLRIAHLGKKMSDETKKKISAANFGRVKSLEEKRNISIARIGKKHSEETKRKMSISKTLGKHYGAKKVIDTSNGKIYDCAKNAAKDAGIHYVTLGRYLTGRRVNKTTLKYL